MKLKNLLKTRNQILLICLLVIILIGVWVWRRVGAEGFGKKALPVYNVVPEFSLTDCSGQPFGYSNLREKIWIADFIFTRCAGPCPLMSTQMATFQHLLSGASDICFVSFTVDPDHDTPEVLTHYADNYGAAKDRWVFLTGNKNTIFRLAREGFHVAATDPSESETFANPIIHSTRFILVDRQGRIRGYYDGLDTQAMRKLLNDVKDLSREKN